MRKRSSKTPNWLLPAILATGVVVLWSGAAKAKTKPANVQTTSVGDRLYSVVRLGQGNYLVTLVSTSGILESVPTNYTFNQVGPLGQTGDSAKVAQLIRDLGAMNLDFSS